MDYVNPMELVGEALQVAKRKAALSTKDLLLRGFLAGAFLAYATSLVMIVLSQGLAPIVGAVLFPVGFVMLVHRKLCAAPRGSRRRRNFPWQTIAKLGMGIFRQPIGKRFLCGSFLSCGNKLRNLRGRPAGRFTEAGGAEKNAGVSGARRQRLVNRIR